MKILTAALTFVAVLSQPNSGRSEDFLRGDGSTVTLASDVGGHTVRWWFLLMLWCLAGTKERRGNFKLRDES